MERIEDIILRHSQRGMTKLRPYMDADYCRLAAEEIYSWKRGVVFLTTGFYVAGYPETDGPTGTAVLASVLRDMGFRPVILERGKAVRVLLYLFERDVAIRLLRAG